MRQFLEKVYKQAINLECRDYDIYFPNGIKRADFLLFGDRVVCEYKEIKTINVRHHVEKIALKGEYSEQDFKRDFYNSINNALKTANKQIKESKQALNLQNAVGLVIIENLIKDDLSVLSLLDAANRKMLGGLENVDCILCLDFVNVFSNTDDSGLVRPAQTLARKTDNGIELCDLLSQLMIDFCEQSNTPLLDGHDLIGGQQAWLVDGQGKYQKYKAKADFNLSILDVKYNWKQSLSQFLNKWLWIMLLSIIFFGLACILNCGNKLD